MQQAKPMDRLVCGDVGFGKQKWQCELAFVAVQNSKSSRGSGAHQLYWLNSIMNHLKIVLPIGRSVLKFYLVLVQSKSAL